MYFIYLTYFVFVNLGANGDEILEKAIVLLSEANVASALFHPNILEANKRDPLVLVQQPDQPGLVRDELLDHPLPGARNGQRLNYGCALSDTGGDSLELLMPLS